MAEEIECSEGEDAAERFKEVTAKILSVPKTEIDERAEEDRASRKETKKRRK